MKTASVEVECSEEAVPVPAERPLEAEEAVADMLGAKEWTCPRLRP